MSVLTPNETLRGATETTREIVDHEVFQAGPNCAAQSTTSKPAPCKVDEVVATRSATAIELLFRKIG